MPSLPQAPATRERLNELVAELCGDQPTPTNLSTAGPRWPQAVTQVDAQLCATLRVAVLPERMRKALELVRANAVTLHADGSASVQSGKQTYTLAQTAPVRTRSTAPSCASTPCAVTTSTVFLHEEDGNRSNVPEVSRLTGCRKARGQQHGGKAGSAEKAQKARPRKTCMIW